MNWIEIMSLVASIASILAFLLFLYFSLALRLKKRELSKRILSLEGSPLVLGINEGAEVLKEIYDKFDEIKLGESNYRIMERSITMKSEEFGCTEAILSYRFASPWLALSQENYSRYIAASLEERKDLLRRILVGNLLSASKGLGYVAKEHIRLDLGGMKDEICVLKGTKVTGFQGQFTTCFAIPDHMGLGKSASRGYGAITRLK